MIALDEFFQKQGCPEFASRELVFIEDTHRKLMACIAAANSIYPKYQCELEERQLLQSKAIGYAEILYQEFEWLIDLYPEKIGLFSQFAEKASYEITLLRRWKKSNNKIRIDKSSHDV